VECRGASFLISLIIDATGTIDSGAVCSKQGKGSAMNEEEYLESRLDDQIAWYNKKSQQNQRWYKRLRLIEIVAACTVPLLAGYVIDLQPLRYVIGILGLLIAVISGVIALYKFQENWTEYRTTCESLQHEKYLYLTRSEMYGSANPFPLLVQRVEALISRENSKWSQYMKEPERGSNNQE